MVHFNREILSKFIILYARKNNADIKRHLIPFPRVGKRQNLIPFPRVGRAGYYQGLFPTDDEEGIQQQFALSAEDSQAPAPSSLLMSSGDILGNQSRNNWYGHRHVTKRVSRARLINVPLGRRVE